ncbi:hypothetical protein PoMZ_04901, partial [Pyricularia oryzae]
QRVAVAYIASKDLHGQKGAVIVDFVRTQKQRIGLNQPLRISMLNISDKLKRKPASPRSANCYSTASLKCYP